MTWEWKKSAIAALLFLLVVAASARVTYLAQQDQRVRDEVTAARQEVCRALYVSGTCPRMTAGAKNRVVRSAVFSGPDIRSLEQLAPVLTKYGWVPAASGNPAHTMFCRAGYAATYTLYEGRAELEFSSGEAVCRIRSA